MNPNKLLEEIAGPSISIDTNAHNIDGTNDSTCPFCSKSFKIVGRHLNIVQIVITEITPYILLTLHLRRNKRAVNINVRNVTVCSIDLILTLEPALPAEEMLVLTFLQVMA